MRTVVLDTNVLLSDPSILTAFEDADVIVPETVLGELDKLKTSRVDPDLRFRGREVSRVLFDLSERGSLIDGVELPEGGSLRVVPLDTDAEIPEGLSTKNADDRILAVAVQLARAGRENVVLVTNDLNMLLKAQTLGVRVQRHFDGAEGSFGRKYIIRPFQRYRVPLTILAVAFAVFVAIILLSIYNPLTSNQGRAGVPQEFRDLLLPQQQQVLDLLVKLEQNPTDADTELQLANTYFDLASQGHPMPYAALSIQHYDDVLKKQPDNLSARVDLAVMLQTAGDTDRAIQETIYVLKRNPNQIQANYNLGIFYWQGRKDYASAEAQFRKVIDLARGNDAASQKIKADAKQRLDQVLKDAKAASAGKTPPSQITTQ